MVGVIFLGDSCPRKLGSFFNELGFHWSDKNVSPVCSGHCLEGGDQDFSSVWRKRRQCAGVNSILAFARIDVNLPQLWLHF